MKMIPIFYCKDIQGAINFYSRVLDFTLADVATKDEPVVSLFNGDAELLLTSLTGDQKNGISVNVLVQDIDGLYKKYTSRGLDQSHRIESPVHLGPFDQTWGTREWYVTDPDGNTLRFVQR